MQKKRTKRIRHKKKSRMLLGLFVLFVFMAAGIVFAGSRLVQNMEAWPQEQETAGIGFDAGNTDAGGADAGGVDTGSVEADAVNEEEWCLTLVNKWNPMKTDGSEVETVQLLNGKRVDKRIYPQLQKMFDDARAAGVYPIVASGYRTQSEQEALFKEKTDAYMAEGMSEEEAREAAEYWVAAPGTSEHQLGLSVDINADGIHSAGNEVYDWLAQNAHKYGFINRYPSDKTDLTGVANEPWHYRYVGTKAAAEIYEQGICLEEYLGA